MHYNTVFLFPLLFSLTLCAVIAQNAIGLPWITKTQQEIEHQLDYNGAPVATSYQNQMLYHTHTVPQIVQRDFQHFDSRQPHAVYGYAAIPPAAARPATATPRPITRTLTIIDDYDPRDGNINRPISYDNPRRPYYEAQQRNREFPYGVPRPQRPPIETDFARRPIPERYPNAIAEEHAIAEERRLNALLPPLSRPLAPLPAPLPSSSQPPFIPPPYDFHLQRRGEQPSLSPRTAINSYVPTRNTPELPFYQQQQEHRSTLQPIYDDESIFLGAQSTTVPTTRQLNASQFEPLFQRYLERYPQRLQPKYEVNKKK